jgi:hypothetical protein
MDEWTAYSSSSAKIITGWLVVRRVLDANTQDPLFPVWRYHPFSTNNTERSTKPTSPTAATPSARPS